MNDGGQPCPCGFQQTYDKHCGRIHESGAGLGSTAEALMRARYSGYVLHKKQFLLDSWHPETRPATLGFDDDLEWLGLEVVATDAGSGFDAHGTVEFIARFRRSDEHLQLHERSSFVRVDGQWRYVDGS